MNGVCHPCGRSTRIWAAGVALLALAALAPAGARAAAFTVPHTVTPGLTVPQAAPAPAPAPSVPVAPSSSSMLGTGGGGTFTPSQAVYPAHDASTIDVGHRAGEASQAAMADDEGPTAAEKLQMQQEDVQAAIDLLQNGFPPPSLYLALLDKDSPLAHAWFLFEYSDTLERILEQQQPEAAVRAVMGYSGVSDQACGADYSQVNEEIEDPGAQVSLC